MAQVSNLVDQVLAGLAEGIRDKCDRAQILAALDELGCATTMDSLREHLLAAPDDLNKALGDVAPAFFVARFQKAATESSDELQARAGADPLLAEPVSTSEVAVSTGGTSGSASRTGTSTGAHAGSTRSTFASGSTTRGSATTRTRRKTSALSS